MNSTADVFLENLRKNPACPHVVIAWGEEEYFKKAVGKAFREKAFASGEEPTEWFFQRDFELEALREAINSVPFFGGQNWVVLEEPRILADKEKMGSRKVGGKGKKKGPTSVEGLIQLLTDVPDYAFVYCICGKLDKRQIFYKTLSKKAPMVECSPLRSYQLQPWLRNQAAAYGARFTPGAMERIQEYAAAADPVPLLFLEQEIRKIALYAGARKLWQAEDVDQMFSQLPEISGFALGNAVEERNLDKALVLLQEERKKNGEGLTILILRLYASLRRLLQVKELLGKGAGPETMAATLKLHPFAVKMALQHSRHFSAEALETGMIDLARLAAESRQGGRNWARLEEVLLALLSQR